jgi:DNA polymerase-3 subunit alpha
MSSRSFLEGYYVKPRVDHQLISEHSEGIIVLSGCLNSEVCQALLRGDYNYALNSAYKMQSIVGKENYFIEMQDHGLGEQKRISNQLIQIANAIGAKIVPTGDCHYVHRHDARSHDVMLCVATNATVNTPDRFSFNGDHWYLNSYDEMSKKFSNEWLDNTMHVCDMVDINLNFGEIHFPDFPIPTKESSVDFFERLAWDGLRTKYGQDLPQHIIDRANHEIKVVKEMGFSEYFLVVSDLVRWSKLNNIRVGWGRGSAAGSILSYAFDITNLDPIRFGLLFERFLVEGRKSMPDIDLDFDDRHRDKVIDYARSKYGEDKVAHICTFNRTGAKQSIRDAARALGYDFATGDKISKLVPPPVLGVAKSLAECMQVTEFNNAYKTEEISKEIIDAAIGLEGLVRQTGIHAAGVVISKGPLTDYLPVMKKGADNPLVTQWDMSRVEQCGLLKIDFLGLRNLGVIDQCIKTIKKKYLVDIDVNKISLDDQETYDELCKGNAVGVFQLESFGMRNLMLQLQPRTIEDIMALISLYRPGPMGSGMDKLYIDRKHGRSKVSFEHPRLEEVLKSSLGVMLYQEDVLAVSRSLAGFNSGEADDLRKVIGKKQMDKIPKLREKFVEGCVKSSGLDYSLANKIFSDIEYFGGYGFNRAHAASYAMISYITAYLKTHYTSEYMAALLTSVAGNKDKLFLYLNDCRKLGIKVLPPSVNNSEIDFEVKSPNEVLFGLGSINGIGASIAESIIKNRDINNPYVSVYDFYKRCDPTVLKKSTLEHLVHSGALDELIETEQDNDINRSSELSILEKEKEELGIYVTKHPLEGTWDIMRANIDLELLDIPDCTNGAYIKVGGIISSTKKIITKKGARMFKFTLEDPTGEIEIIVFPKDAKNYSDEFFKVGEIAYISGTLNRENEDENSSHRIFLSNLEKVDNATMYSGKAIYLDSDQISSTQLKKIYDIINSNNGNRQVYFNVKSNLGIFVYKFNKTTNKNAEKLIKDLLEEN